jgi:hypothetical protein
MFQGKSLLRKVTCQAWNLGCCVCTTIRFRHDLSPATAEKIVTNHLHNPEIKRQGCSWRIRVDGPVPGRLGLWSRPVVHAPCEFFFASSNQPDYMCSYPHCFSWGEARIKRIAHLRCRGTPQGLTATATIVAGARSPTCHCQGFRPNFKSNLMRLN